MARRGRPTGAPAAGAATGTGAYESPSVQGLFYTKVSGYVNLGLKKQLWHERATLSLKFNDVFNTSRFRSSMQYNNVNLTWNNQWESRRLALSFTYKLAGGQTHSARPSGSADGESRAGHQRAVARPGLPKKWR